MDEPTSVLTPQEVERLFETLRKLGVRGHVHPLHLPQAGGNKALCDRATILRGGKVVATCDPKAETARSMAQLMIGTELKTVTAAAAALTVPAVRGRGPVAARGRVHGTDLKNISFAVRAGERSSASPGWRATARTSCCWRSPANAWPITIRR
jgi:general nucleoside transport system ATP-binding protein